MASVQANFVHTRADVPPQCLVPRDENEEVTDAVFLDAGAAKFEGCAYSSLKLAKDSYV